MRPRIYISYSSHTKGAEKRIFRLAESLRGAGIDARIDHYYHQSRYGMLLPAPRAGQKAWDLWQEEQIKKADRVLIVCDQEYAGTPATPGVALDLKFMQADLNAGAKQLDKFIPVGFGPYSLNSTFVPAFIAGANYYDLSKKSELEGLIRRFRTEFQVVEKAPPPAATRHPSSNPTDVIPNEKSRRSIVWLHLSDLHNCKERTGWDAHRVLQPLIKDLKRMEVDHGLTPQILFFTGDAAYGNVPDSNLEKQFDGAHELIETARQAFSTPLPKENVFIVPGNHDVDRDAVTPDQTSWLATQAETPIAVNQLIQKAGTQWKRFMERLAAYRDFLARHHYTHLLADPARLIFSQVRELHGIKLGIAGFNSAWSCSGDDDRGNLWFGGDWQLGELTGKLPNTDFRVALIHHPFGWFVAPEDTPLRIPFEREFAFLLHGHEHLGWVDAKANGYVRVAGGACYDKSALENGYNFVRLDLETGEGEIWLRRYDAQGGGWVPRVVAGTTTNDGLWLLGKLPWLQPLLAKAQAINP